MRRPQGMAGSSLLRSLGRRMKATAAEFRAIPNAAEVRGVLGRCCQLELLGWELGLSCCGVPMRSSSMSS